MICGCFVWGIVLFSGCSDDDKKDGPDVEPGADSTAIVFNGSIEERSGGSDAEWQSGDQVGIFMLLPGGSFTNNGILSGKDNVLYTVSDPATGALSPSGEAIYHPQNRNVDFVAYSPYGQKGDGAGKISSDYEFGVSVVEQADPDAIDVLYAKKENQSKENTTVSFSFRHVLSKITLNVTAGEGVEQASVQNLVGDAVSFTDMIVDAALNLQDGTLANGQTMGRLTACKETAVSGADATFSFVVIPQALEELRVKFVVDGQELEEKVALAEISAETHYTYSVTVKPSRIEIRQASIDKWETNVH